MDKQLKDRMGEWLTWYNWHHSQLQNADVGKRVAFLDKCVQGLFEMLVKVAEEGDRLDQRRDKPVIMLSTGIKFDSSIRERDTA